MEPFSQLSTKPAGQEAEVRPARYERNSTMFNSVKVDPSSFTTLIYLQSFERKEYVEGGNVPDDQKPQKRNKDGVPVWTVELTAVPWRGRSRTIRVNVASNDDPSDRLSAGELVQLVDAEFGVTPKDGNDGGYSIWMIAQGVEPASGRKPISAVA